MTDDQIKAELAATIALHEQQDATQAIVEANETRKQQEEEISKKLDKQKEKAEQLNEAIRSELLML